MHEQEAHAPLDLENLYNIPALDSPLFGLDGYKPADVPERLAARRMTRADPRTKSKKEGDQKGELQIS